MVLDINFFARRADLLYDPAQVTVEQMARALSRYGYRASPAGEAMDRPSALSIPQR